MTAVVQRVTVRRMSALVGVAAAVLCVNLLVIGPITLRSAWHGNGDFLGLYTGARLAPENQEYDLSAILRLQTSIFGEQRPKFLAVRLPFYYKLLSPLGRLPYRRAHRVWLVLILAASAAAVPIYPFPNRLALAAASIASFPLLQATVVSQDIGIVCLILVTCPRNPSNMVPEFNTASFCRFAFI